MTKGFKPGSAMTVDKHEVIIALVGKAYIRGHMKEWNKDEWQAMRWNGLGQYTFGGMEPTNNKCSYDLVPQGDLELE